MLTQKNLMKVLHYSQRTGVFTWKNSGEVAGCLSVRGYWIIGINGKRMMAHRLAFLYMLGFIPPMVDHKNRNKIDNRWTNIRETNKKLNAGNMVRRPGKIKGVTKNHTKWCAAISIGGKRIFLGNFDCPNEAGAAYAAAAKKHFGKFARF